MLYTVLRVGSDNRVVSASIRVSYLTLNHTATVKYYRCDNQRNDLPGGMSFNQFQKEFHKYTINPTTNAITFSAAPPVARVYTAAEWNALPHATLPLAYERAAKIAHHRSL